MIINRMESVVVDVRWTDMGKLQVKVAPVANTPDGYGHVICFARAEWVDVGSAP